MPGLVEDIQRGFVRDTQREVFDKRLLSTPSPCGRFLHDLMERQSIRYPNTPAICAWDVSFTYGQMKEHSTRLANHLRSLSVAKGTIVPILSVKSGWVPVAILAILKAGGAILTTDPSHPPERLAAIIARVKAKVAICSDCVSSVEKLVFPTIEHRVHINDISELHDAPTDILPFRLDENTSPAYIIFTSGSTGTPKGVVVDHSAIVMSASGFGTAAQMSPSSRVIQFSAHSFDVCILELCITLCFGGVVCIPSEQERMDDIAGAMERMRVNSAFITPTVARIIDPDDVPSLQNLLLCGEPSHVENVQRWAPRINNLYNGYGPAETSVLCSVMRMPDITSNPRNVGKPLNCSAWIVNHDENNILCPDGTAGELVIMGPVVGLSYLDDPEKTAAVFMKQPDWFNDGSLSELGHRLYKTGDSAYLTPDGTIMIVGRRDNQIKLHGQRIELGEIEQNLREVLPAQTNLVVDVITPGDGDGNKQLAAFIVLPKTGNKTELDVSDMNKSLLTLLKKLRTDILGRIPKYMCPSVYIPILEMPETTSTKADRKALRAFGSSKTLKEISTYNGVDRIHHEPATTMDMKLQQFWAEILKVDPSEIGGTDSFFMLGGDPIKAILLVKLAQKSGYLLSYQDIFMNPELSPMSLSAKELVETSVAPVVPFSIISNVEDAQAAWYRVKSKLLDAGLCNVVEGIYPSIAELDRAYCDSIQDIAPSTAEQDRMIRQTLVKPSSHILSFPYKLDPAMDLNKFRRACELVVQAFLILRTRFICMSNSTSVQVVMNEKIQWQELKAGAEHAEPLVIAFGKPMTSWATSDSTVIFQIHHALLDGWSLELLWKALEHAYKKGTAPPVAASFNSLMKYYESQEHEVTDIFWRAELKNAHASILLTMPSIPGYIPFQTHRLERTSLLEMPKNSRNITISTILQVAFGITLSKLENSKDIVFRTTGTGRNQPVPDLQEIMGAVLTSFPVRMEFNSSESVLQLLERVQKHNLEVSRFEYRGIEHIKNLTDNSKGIVCDSNTPYLIVQSGSFGQAFEGLTKLDTAWVPSQTPLSVCCIPKSGTGTMKIATGYDSNMICKALVMEFLKLFECTVHTVLCGLENGSNAETQFERMWEWFCTKYFTLEEVLQ